MKEEEFFEQQLKDISMRNQMAERDRYNQNTIIEEQEKSMVKEQLDLDSVIKQIDHLLRGHIIKRMKDGSEVWVEPEDRNMIILSEYGVQFIVNSIRFYLNQNTLLSNYEETVIYNKMEDFATALADAVFMEYEVMFEYPTFQECKKVLMDRIGKKKDVRKFAYELLGKKVDDYFEKKIEEGIIRELEGRVESELEKIKQQLIKNKLKRFEVLIRYVQDAVHSAYLRAWKGQERTTLRQHIHISENRGQQSPYHVPSKFNPMNWTRQ